MPEKRKRKKNPYLNNRDLLAQVKISLEEGKMTDPLANMLMMLVKRYSERANFANYCVDKDTEALTQRGWTRYNQISTNDKILSYDPKTRKLVWSNIQDLYINQEYVGPMHKLDTQGLDALVTPNHKFVSAERGIIPVEDIICNEHIVLTGLPVSDPETLKYSNSFVETVGWAITEGHYIKGSVRKRCISLSQKEGRYADKIRNCLTESNIPFKEYMWRDGLAVFNCTGEDICNIYDDIAPNRVLSPEFILSLTQSQRLLLIETMVNADGWYRPNGGMSYVQKDPKHIDSFLMLCTLAGLTTSTVPMTYKTPVSKKNPNGGTSDVLSINIYSQPKLQCNAEHIDFHGGRPSPGGRREQKANTPTQQYDGVIWCPQTEFGTFVCRRNKYIYVTGNTYIEDMRGYALMELMRSWPSFKPHVSTNAFAFFTQCVKNSFIQYLNKERRQRDIRDSLLVHSGLTPSFTYQMQQSEKSKVVDDEEDWNSQQKKKEALETNEEQSQNDFITY